MKNGLNSEFLVHLWMHRNRSPVFIIRAKFVKGTQIFFGYFFDNLTEDKIKEKKIVFE